MEPIAETTKGFAVSMTPQKQTEEPPVGVGLSRIEHGVAQLEEKIGQLEGRLSMVLTPVDDSRPEGVLGSVGGSRSVLADHLSSHADSLESLLHRLEQIRIRIEL